LYAPKSGKETRTIIKEKAAKVKDRIEGDIRAIQNKSKLDDLKQK
jgi:gas vesicle protein